MEIATTGSKMGFLTTGEYEAPTIEALGNAELAEVEGEWIVPWVAIAIAIVRWPVAVVLAVVIF
jgi:hypothetical protein